MDPNYTRASCFLQESKNPYQGEMTKGQLSRIQKIRLYRIRAS